jgi:hypothetical protein
LNAAVKSVALAKLNENKVSMLPVAQNQIIETGSCGMTTAKIEFDSFNKNK